jgi:TRAP-type C4-dicarboxylate transport system permease small subunit
MSSGAGYFPYQSSGYIDRVEQAMVFFAFFGLAFTQREGGHIRMDIAV